MSAAIGALQARYLAVPAFTRGAALIVISTFCFAAMHAIIRHLSADLHAFEIAFFRNLFGVVVLTPFFLRNGIGILRTRQLKLHGTRAGLQVISMLMFFSAVAVTPLAKVSALSFTAPLFATIGAILFLGERVRFRRISALLVGFVGALIIVRPGLVALDSGSLLVIASSALWACSMLIIKVLTRTESSLTVTAYMAILMTPLSFLPALFVWQWPDWPHWGWFVLMGAVGTIGHVLMAEAFKQAEASAILPFDFTRLIWAALLGFLLFAQVPEIWTWVGGAVIFAASTYIAFREMALQRQGRD